MTNPIYVIVFLLVACGGSAYVGYQYRDGVAAREELKLKREHDEKVDQMATHLLSQSADYEDRIRELENKQPIIRRIVEKEIANPAYSCKLPTSGLRNHESIVESLNQSRSSGKSNSEVSVDKANGTTGR